MTYASYLYFYNLEDTEEHRIDWMYNEWHHGRAYKYEGKFYDVETGKQLV